MQALLFSTHVDESAILSAVLQQAGFVVRIVRELERSMEVWPERPSDLVLIVLEGDGTRHIHTLKQMRAHIAAPVVVIADLQPEESLVGLLEAGADLLITRPYGGRLLLAKIKALMRRGAGVPFASLPTLTRRDLVLDPGTRTVSVGEDQPRRLTQLEFRLLYVLLTNSGQIITTENLVELVWGYSGEGNRDLVRGLVKRLRAKVEPIPHQPQYIITEPGIGYYFNRFDEL